MVVRYFKGAQNFIAHGVGKRGNISMKSISPH